MSIYSFDVQAGIDAMDWANLNGLPEALLYKEVGLNHHSELLSFIVECQTYPTAQSKLLALEIANRFNPSQGKAWPTQGQLAERLGVGREVIRKYTADLKSTGYWDVRKDPVTGTLSYHLSPETMVVLAIWLKRVREGKRDYGFNTPSLILKAAKARPGRRIPSKTSPEPTEEPTVESYQDLVDMGQALIETHDVTVLSDGKHSGENLEVVSRIAAYLEEREALPEGHSFHLIKHMLNTSNLSPDELLEHAETLVKNRKA